MKDLLKDKTIFDGEFDIILIDGLWQFHRYYSALINLSGNGIRTGGIYGFLNSLLSMRKKYINDFKKIYVLWDGSSKMGYLKKEKMSDYKANRIKMEGNFYEQLNILQELLCYLGIPQVKVDRIEADDLAHYFVKKKFNNKMILLVAKDSDWYYLLDNNVRITSKLGETKKASDIRKEGKFDIDYKKIILYKSIIGDKKDNIFGISRMNKNFVKEMLEHCNSLKDIFNYCSKNNKNKNSQKILKDENLIRRNHKILNFIKLENSDVKIDYGSKNFKKFSKNSLELKMKGTVKNFRYYYKKEKKDAY